MPLETKKDNNKYSDFRDDFRTHPVKRDLVLARDEEAVKQSIKNLLFTGPYERRLRPGIGAGLKKYLFELVSPVTATLIRSAIVRCIQTYEPRAELVDVNVQVQPDQNSYSATITFRVINRIDPITFTAILERVR
jgi:phage baseplate assembly protein W